MAGKAPGTRCGRDKSNDAPKPSKAAGEGRVEPPQCALTATAWEGDERCRSEQHKNATC
jgi:hypothetical protein